MDIRPAPPKTRVANEKEFRVLLLNRSQSITGIRRPVTGFLIASLLIGTARGNRLVSGLQSKANQSALDDLSSEITVRHYSPKTLKTYTLWVKKFQLFTQNKDPQLLSSNDVKEFLTFLAVKRKVSASTQNQAFNALLFLYRRVIKKDFENLKDTPRAKRKRYIPVVLSREEIDTIF